MNLPGLMNLLDAAVVCAKLFCSLSKCFVGSSDLMPHEASGRGRFRSNEPLMCRLRELELFVLYPDQYFPQEPLLYCRVVHDLIIVPQSLPNPPCHDRQLDPGVSMSLQHAKMRVSSRVCLLKLISLSVSVQAQLVLSKTFFTTH